MVIGVVWDELGFREIWMVMRLSRLELSVVAGIAKGTSDE
jgi:hypothetical protein